VRALQEHVKAEIAPYKYPRAIAFLDSLPRTGSGKVKRFELRARAATETARDRDMQPQDTKTTLIPGMHYRDAPAAINWLCRAFGFERHLVVPGPDGTITHAQLVFGNGMVMLGSQRAGEFSRFTALPEDAGGRCTQSVYVVVSDVDEHHRRAAAAGAEIVKEPTDEEYGGRGYGCRDPEGHVWWFGTYDPWT
jgi:uncharacterized glyoxalase superfamily protein PhnB